MTRGIDGMVCQAGDIEPNIYRAARGVISLAVAGHVIRAPPVDGSLVIRPPTSVMLSAAVSFSEIVTSKPGLALPQKMVSLLTFLKDAPSMIKY